MSAHTGTIPILAPGEAGAEPVRLELRMTGAEGCAVRALGLIVRRGWYLVAAHLQPGLPGETRTLTVDVLRRDEARAVETLKRQLERLYDLDAVTILDDAAKREAA
ncbi:MAG: hypothetical protein ACFB2Z_05995 [Maricaulaceae bacterium]